MDQDDSCENYEHQQICVFKRKHLELCELVGNGLFGKVYRGMLVTSNSSNSPKNQRQKYKYPTETGLLAMMEVAIKIPHKTIEVGTSKYCRNRSRNEVLYEIQILSKLQHPNLVRFIGMVENKDCTKLPWLVMEFMPKGNLESYLQKYPEIRKDQEFLFSCSFQIACGMAYLHRQGIVHCDLHLQNCLIAIASAPTKTTGTTMRQNDKQKESEVVVKIGDFGQSFVIVNEEDALQGALGKYGRPTGISVESIYGARWKSPEVIPGPNFAPVQTRSGDSWSYGILLFELWTAELPYASLSDQEIPKAILSKKDPFDFTSTTALSIPVNISVLMMDCWNYCPNSRPTFNHIVNTLKDSECMNMQ